MTTDRRHTPLSAREAEPSRCNGYVRLQALSRVPLLAGLDARALGQIDARCTLSHRQADEAVYRHGRAAERVYIPVFGTIKLLRATPGGEEVLLDIVGRGELIGSLPVLGGGTYAETAIALTPTCLLSLGADAFDWVLDTYPQVARTALTLSGSRLHRARSAIERLGTASAEQRVVDTLTSLADRLGVPRDGTVLIDAPLRREDLASLAGCASETASRVLARLGREGILDTGRRWIAVRDPARLRALSTSSDDDRRGAPR